MKNSPRGDMTVKEGYGYGSSRQYHGSSGTGHRSCASCSSLLGGMPAAGLLQSRKETYNGWDDVVGKIYTSVFFGMFLASFLLLL